MLSCLIDYIGLSYPDGVYNTSESGFYLSSLPGITVESVDKISDSEQGHYHKVWEDVQTQAVLKFEQDVTLEISKCHELSLYCDYEDLICTNKKILARPWMYLLGSQLMIERIYSTRINRFTTVDIPMAKELKDYYHAEYEEALKLAVQLMDVTACELCCGDNPHHVTWKP